MKRKKTADTHINIDELQNIMLKEKDRNKMTAYFIILLVRNSEKKAKI